MNSYHLMWYLHSYHVMWYLLQVLVIASVKYNFITNCCGVTESAHARCTVASGCHFALGSPQHVTGICHSVFESSDHEQYLGRYSKYENDSIIWCQNDMTRNRHCNDIQKIFNSAIVADNVNVCSGFLVC